MSPHRMRQIVGDAVHVDIQHRRPDAFFSVGLAGAGGPRSGGTGQRERDSSPGRQRPDAEPGERHGCRIPRKAPRTSSIFTW